MFINESGFQEIHPKLSQKIFGESKAKKVEGSGEYDGEDLELPELRGSNLLEHFEAIAGEYLGDTIELIEEFVEKYTYKVIPIDWVLKESGWVRYGYDGKIDKVDHPIERVFTFDCETFVKGGNFPVMATAVSLKAVYLWLSPEILNPSLPISRSLINVGKGNVIIGHNVNFDRVRTIGAYTLESPDNYWLCTQAMHIACSGLASEQRYIYNLKHKKDEDLEPHERLLRKYPPHWVDEGATNSLVEVYNFYVTGNDFWGEYPRFDLGDKKIRDKFVTANTMFDLTAYLDDLIEYAIKDTYYTALLFKHLWWQYRESTPTLTAIAGHIQLLTSKIPLDPDWYKWVSNCDRIYEDMLNKVSELVRGIANGLYKEWSELFKVDFKKIQNIGKLTVKIINEYNLTNPEWYTNSAKLGDDPWYSELDWSPMRYKNNWFPTWYLPIAKEPDKTFSTKSKLTHTLLKLTWNGLPVRHTKEFGYCFVSKDFYLEVDEKNLGQLKENPEYCLYKIPHKKGDDNVGVLLSKDYLPYYEQGIFSGEHPRAKEVLDIGVSTSYWTSVNKRVKERITRRVHNPYGEDFLMTAPCILPHGTITRRTVENLMVTLCGHKPNKIGTELMSRIKAPKGWKLVTADFDQQEINIASIFADAYQRKPIGGSNMSRETLGGTKENASDTHTNTAKDMIINEWGFFFEDGQWWVDE